MSYFKTCPHCGAHLDPAEVCDCRAKEEAAQGAANAPDGKVEKVLTGSNSTSMIPRIEGGLQDEIA